MLCQLPVIYSVCRLTLAFADDVKRLVEEHDPMLDDVELPRFLDQIRLQAVALWAGRVSLIELLRFCHSLIVTNPHMGMSDLCVCLLADSESNR